MEAMYKMALLSHVYSIYGALIVVAIHFVVAISFSSLAKLRRFLIIFTPIGSIMIASAIFTGIIMMAAKHLDFTSANIVMIVAATLFIVLEVLRSKALKSAKELLEYRSKAIKLLSAEALLLIGTIGAIHAGVFG